MVIDCDTCRLRHTDACRDCLVTFLVDRPPGGAVDIAPRDVAPLRALQDGGLVPELRHTGVEVGASPPGDLRRWAGASGPRRR